MASKLKYPGELYQPTWKFLKENFTEAEMKREYSRLRDIAQKRLARMGDNEFSRSTTYMENVGKFPVLSEFKDKSGKIVNRSDFAYTMAKLARFIESPISTTRGQQAVKNRTIQSLHSAGYSFVNASNYWDFMDYMNQAREQKLVKFYDSERIVGMYRAARSKKIPTDVLLQDFEYFIKNKSYLRRVKRPESGSWDSEYIRSSIEAMKEARKQERKKK